MNKNILLLAFALLFFFSKNSKAQVTIDSIAVKFDSLAYDSLKIYYNSSLIKVKVISGLHPELPCAWTFTLPAIAPRTYSIGAGSPIPTE